MENKSFQFKVYSELYGETDACVLDIERAIKTKCCPCGDGNDYRFTLHEYRQLLEGKFGENFTPSSMLENPLNLIAAMIPDGSRLLLPTQFRFNKKDYSIVKRELEKAGGKYSKNSFLFEEDAETVYNHILNGEEYNLKKKYQFFETPDILADRLVELAEIRDKDVILEPSAGNGAIVKAIHREFPYMDVYGYEIMEQNHEHLSKLHHFKLLGSDFLKECDTDFDVIIANPPFSGNQDIDHIYNMYNHLTPSGRLVSIASPHFLLSSGKKEQAFKKWLEEKKAEIHLIERGAFKDSGTMIESRIIVIRKFIQKDRIGV